MARWALNFLFLGASTFWSCSADSTAYSELEAQNDWPSTSFSESSQWSDYAEGLSERTIGFGIGLAIILGFINFWVCVGCCCRSGSCCCKCCVDKSLREPDQPAGFTEVIVDPNAEAQNRGRMGMVINGAGLQSDKVPSIRKMWCFWGLWLVMFVMSLIGAGLAYQGAVDTASTATTGMDQFEDFFLDTAAFLCSEEDTTDNEECDENSVGDFLEDCTEEVVGVLDSAVDALEGIEDIVYAAEDAVTVVATGFDVLGDAKDVVLEINSTLAELAAQFSYWGNPNNTGGIDFSGDLPDQSSLPTVSSSDLSAFTTAEDSLVDALVSANDTLIDLRATYTSTVLPFIYAIDDISGNEETTGSMTSDLRAELSSEIDSYVDEVKDYAGDMIDYAEDVASIRDDSVTPNTDLGTGLMGLFAFIPGMALVFFGIGFFVSKNRCCMGFSMVEFFLLNGFFCVIFGLLYTFYTVNSDVCDNFEYTVYTVFNDESDSDEYSFMGSGNTVGGYLLDVLNCADDNSGDDATSEDNNLLDILDLRAYLNVSSTLVSIASEFDSALDELDPVVAELANASASIDSVVSDAVDGVDIGSSFNGSEYLATVRAVQTDNLAPYPFNRSDPDDQQALTDTYSAGDLGSSTWSAYQSAINLVNTIMTEIDAATSGGLPAPYKTNYNFENAPEFNSTVVENILGDFYQATSATSTASDNGAVTYGSTYDYNALKGAITAKDAIGDIFEDVIAANDEAYERINVMYNLVNTTVVLVDSFADTQDAISDYAANVVAAFDNITDTVEDVIDDLEGLVDDVLDLQDFVYTIGDYLHCAFIGNFYRDFFQDTWCGDLNDNMYSLSQAFLVVVLTMFFSHFLIGVYWPTFVGFAKRAKAANEVAFDA
mmetsp:Transcript_3010/g.5221  ORF Transcript_3010/g.5221 Transcript_3010/m.5221 type:complete len:883 (+) Transcript_3010:110-2758(+)